MGCGATCVMPCQVKSNRNQLKSHVRYGARPLALRGVCVEAEMCPVRPPGHLCASGWSGCTYSCTRRDKTQYSGRAKSRQPGALSAVRRYYVLGCAALPLHSVIARHVTCAPRRTMGTFASACRSTATKEAPSTPCAVNGAH
eukprot:5496159-Prymnesium_polylepis.1